MLNHVNAIQSTILGIRDQSDNHTLPFDLNCEIENVPIDNNWTYPAKCVKEVTPFNETCTMLGENEAAFSFDINCLLARECMCVNDNHVADTIFNLGPFLYPFSIEFNILVGN